MADIKKVLLVVNPISGAVNKSDLIKEIKNEIIKRNLTLFIFETTGEEDTFNLNNNIAELQPGRILVVGGDGTIKIAAEALKGKDIPIGIIPA
ncbi:acylglycerol kinase family protein [Antarcticibacterium sp. 1MA-6-2]|uniref:diacylglycerol/lipid kinase family protein n=1 Tax=Antarcticibacterium sp. 1MA-6-2 TaxID=2908210 RepID=UPI001F3B3471|nr:acylglycerol kinase family protein [Antarcticibacterium sp. 1MA-6-2]UJH92001.1 acylglycerol kinase family protein [Antarcticibacterium sp. 1MA-6-2]